MLDPTHPSEERSLTADNPTSDAPWLTPGVVGIGGASLLADVGHEIPTALLPSLLTSTLGAPASALGAIESISDALARGPWKADVTMARLGSYDEELSRKSGGEYVGGPTGV